MLNSQDPVFKELENEEDLEDFASNELLKVKLRDDRGCMYRFVRNGIIIFIPIFILLGILLMFQL